MLTMPSDEFLKGLGPHALANELEVQRCIETHIAPAFGLRVVSSSMAGLPKVGYIDTTAIDADGTPTIIEYKWDIVGGDAIQQVTRYKLWLLNHRDIFAQTARGEWKSQPVNWEQIQLVTVGYRYHQSAARLSDDDSQVILLRYGYRPDATLFIQQLDRMKLPSTGHPPRVLSKDHYLDQHLAKTTAAARAAFKVLRRRFIHLGLTEKIYGKNRVTYGSEPPFAEVTFTDVALRFSFVAGNDIKDPEGRGRRARTTRRPRWICGIASPADVEYVLGIAGKALSSRVPAHR